MITAAFAFALAVTMLHPLPVLKGKYLTGRDATLPADSKGKVALLAFGFSYDSRHAVEDWSNRFRKDFAKDGRVTFYEIPVISGAAQLGKWFIDSGMRKGTPKELHENVITLYGGAGPWKKYFNYRLADDAYLVLLDQSGAVRWHYAGKFDDAAYRELEAAMAKVIER
ncbi:MAG: hypothetical protein NTW28_17860 [Candidatus Solibacter sp.]|nr:hypothetical protein [Candidatus Solibacter sp.]